MEPSELRSLFDAFYDRLVLRDFFGKIVPGLVFLGTVWVSFASNETEPASFITNLAELSALGWIAIFGAAWITAFALQAFGESFPATDRTKRLILYYSPELFDDDEAWYKFFVDFRKKATPDERVQCERFVVIKEACGNGYVSLGVSVLFAVAIYAFRLFFADDPESGEVSERKYLWLPVLLIALFLVSYLGKMHRSHVDRQCKYMKVVVERPDGDGSPTSKKPAESGNAG
jgi:hypothetical protein